MYLTKLMTVIILLLVSTSLMAQDSGLGRSESSDPEQINRSLNSQKVKSELAEMRNDGLKRGKISSYSSRVIERARTTKANWQKPKVVEEVKAHKKTSPRLTKGGAIASGVFIHLGISAASSIVNHVNDGCSFKETVSGTFDDLTRSEFLLGDLLGGTIGAVAGSMMPLPGALSAMPAIGLATIGAQLGHQAITLMKEDNFSLSNLFKAIDIPSIIGQTLGATLGVAAAAAILPGTIGAIIGGMAGGYIGLKLLQCCFPKDETESLSNESNIQKMQVCSPVGTPSVDEARKETDVIELSKEVKRAYEELLSASQKGSPEAPILLEKYKALQQELQTVWALQASD